MPGARMLLTGPHGAAVRDRLQDDPSGLWLVPSELARVQVLSALGRRSSAGRVPRVWCWKHLWRASLDGRDDGPARLSEAAAHAAMGLAVARARDAGLLTATTEAVARW